MADTSRTPVSNSKEPIPFDERARRVLELKRQVKAGLYRPDPGEVARAILAQWFELGLELEREAQRPAAAAVSDWQRTASHFIVEKTAPAADESEASRTA
jgi:hypothetical protein